MINPILGIDTWEGQLEIDEAVLKSNNVQFVFVRLNNMNGGHHKDVGFDKQWREAAGFFRAPYFVYNPWVSGLANFQWLDANMPAEARAVALDVEVRRTGYTPAAYASEFSKFEALVKAKWNYVIYTGEWFLTQLSAWNTKANYWWAQYPAEFYPASTMALTWDALRAKLGWYLGPGNASKCPGKVTFWQFSGDRLILPGNAREMDVNVFLGTQAELESFFGGTVSPAPTDVISTPHDGVTRSQGTLNSWRYVLDVMEPAKLRFDTVALAVLTQVSSVAQGAIKGSNCGEWNDRYPDQPNYLKPINYTVSKGKVITPRTGPQPSLLILNDGSVRIDHKPVAGVVQAFTGLRYLLMDGQRNPAFVDNGEGHSRKVFALNAAGQLMELSTEGAYPNQGWTLTQCLEFLQARGAVVAADFGGGGDATCWADGKLLLTPENSGGRERYLPQVFLVYAKGASMNGTAIENLGKIPTVRSTPTVATGNDVARLAAGARVEWLEIVPDSNPAIARQWLKLADGNYVNYTDATHTGLGAYFKILTQPTVDPVPPTPSTLPDVPFTFEIGDDVKYVKQTFSGILKAK